MMRRKLARLFAGSAVAMILFAGPAWAVQCGPYARMISGFDLYGSAWRWWSEADGQYDRGKAPEVGAALVFKQSPRMPSGHVAIVTKVVNARVIKVDHANWSPSRGHKGTVEKDVSVVDESPNNDWSQVRVWYGPIRDYGLKVYPVYGFIYR
jgi:surface antigen